MVKKKYITQSQMEEEVRQDLDQRLRQLAKKKELDSDEEHEFIETLIMAEKFGLDITVYPRIMGDSRAA